jgi:hypothetical protein
MGIPVKKPSLSEPNIATDSADRGFWILLPVDAVNYLEHTAQSKAISLERLLQQLITEHVTEETRSLEDRMNHLNELLKELVVAVKNPQMLPKIAGTAAFEERQHKRDHIVELGLRALEEVSRISESDQLAKESGSRLRAFTVLARVGAFTDAVIHNQDEADVLDLLERMEQINRELQKELKKAKEKTTYREDPT